MHVTHKLSTLSKSRLWAEAQTGRVFLATTESHPVGSTLTFEAEAPDLHERLTLTGVVAVVQPLGERTPAGVHVALDHQSVERCKGLLVSETRASGRTEPRTECDLEARVLDPSILPGRVRSLSANGLTVKTPSPIPTGTRVGLSVSLPDGEVLVHGDVVWSRSELSLAGVRLDVSAPMAARLGSMVEQMLGQKPAVEATGLTVLVADDDPSILDFTSLVITRSGLRALRAERGDTALELARKERPALMLLDVLMPGLDGLEVCRAVRADAELKATPVVLLSAMGEARLAQAAADVGASAWLTKPMRIESLRELFTRFARKHA